MLFVCALGVAVYHFFYEATKPSPVQHLSWVERSTVAAWTILLALLVSTLGVLVAGALDLAVRRRGGPWGTTIVAATICGLGVLAFVDNFTYSAAGIGLRTETGAVPFKAVLAVLVLCVGVLAGRASVRLSERTVRTVLVGVPVLCLPAAVVAGVAAAGDDVPAELSARDDTDRFNVLILSADGIDADHMSVYGYKRSTTPFLSSVADQLATFDNAFTNNGNTTGSITALLTGRTPAETGVVYPPDTLSAQDARRNLPFLLQRLGYRTSNWAVPHYSDARAQNMLDAFDVDNGYRQSHSPITRLPLGAGPARWFVTETVESSIRMVADIAGVEEMDNPYAAVETVIGDVLGDEGRLTAVTSDIKRRSPFFINSHFMVTHGPRFHPTRAFWSRGPQDRDWMVDPYDDAIRQFDDYVRRIWTVLESSGKLEDTMVIVTSDHGQQYDARKRVPLLVRFPGGTSSGRFDVNVQRIDVAPTVLEVLGYEPPSWMAGHSLAKPESIPADREIFAANTYSRAFTKNMGVRPPDGSLVLTHVRCRWWTQLAPDGTRTSGKVAGSTSRCIERPSAPEPGTVP